MAKEMGTATMISQIEKLLPPLQRREWALLIQKENPEPTGIKFKFFLDYLLREKYAMEYMQQDLRLSEASRKEVNIAKVDDTDESIDEKQGIINALQQQMRENQITLNKVVDGLSLVSQAISTGYSKRNDDQHIRKHCWYHGVDNHLIYDCSGYKGLDGRGKFESVRKNGACFNCLKRGHISRNCLERKLCDVVGTNGQMCGRYHHPILHPIEGLSLHNSNINSKGVMLMINQVKSYNQSVTTLLDPGANVSFVTDEGARRLGLTGEHIYLNITKVGNVTDHVKSKKYIIPLIDNKGKHWDILAHGIGQVTGDVNHVNMEKFAGLFKNITTKDLERPTGKLDLLIGTDYCKILPRVVEQVDSLQLLKNQFGYCIRGYHSDAVHTTSNVQIDLLPSVNVEICSSVIKESSRLVESIKNFLHIEGLGVQIHPKCGKCGCGKCVIGSGTYTIQEEREMHLIEEGIQYNEGHRFTVVYPWIKNPMHLPNNFKAALARLQSTQRRLSKYAEEYLDKYNEQVNYMLERKVARILSTEELKEYKGPIHYIPHHEIL